jgi:Flp pilus assembly protein TadD
MNAALWLALAFSSSGVETCRPCHAAIVDAYLKTGMGRSVRKPALPPGGFFHRLSNRHYTIRDGTLRRHQLDATGAEINIIEKSIDVVIGSGNHAQTLAHRDARGRWLELPITRYPTFYAMSPGYDRPDHLDFRRQITPNCLFCHSASLDPAPIDCARCHGSTAEHLRNPRRGSILNPANLEPARQLDICLQCHLETASRGIPDSLLMPGRAVFSFRPGENLTSYKVYFDRSDPPVRRFEVNHAGYRLLQSACFQKSAGRMTCTTCHDPHTAKVRDACSQCHSSEHARQAAGCASCHMPKRRTQDAIHVAMTDHWIQRKPIMQEPEREDHTPYTGSILPFAPRSNLSMLPRAQAQLRADRERSSQALRALTPTAHNLALLGEALARERKFDEAMKILNRALKSAPTNPAALNALAVIHGTRGRIDQALALLQTSAEANPDHPLTWLNLGVTWEARGDPARAESAYREAIRHQPDYSEARHRLATLKAK